MNNIIEQMLSKYEIKNLNDEIKNIGIDPVKIVLGHLQEAEEDKNTVEDLFPKAQVLKDVATLETTL